MVDIRSEKDKDRAGVPRLPSSAKKGMIAIPLEELPSKLRSLVRNTKKVEAEIAALKISYLKKINKGSSIVIMDFYCDSAKTVARTLTSLGFNNCFVVADGFSGSRGWLQSRLGTDTYNFSVVEILSPLTVFPAAAKCFGTTSTKFLPAPSLRTLSGADLSIDQTTLDPNPVLVLNKTVLQPMREIHSFMFLYEQIFLPQRFPGSIVGNQENEHCETNETQYGQKQDTQVNEHETAVVQQRTDQTQQRNRYQKSTQCQQCVCESLAAMASLVANDDGRVNPERQRKQSQ
ncbi:hypothetical protein V6N13_026778 [Hibiscus sabdariffa]